MSIRMSPSKGYQLAGVGLIVLSCLASKDLTRPICAQEPAAETQAAETQAAGAQAAGAPNNAAEKEAKPGSSSSRRAIAYYSDAAGYQNKGAYKLAIEQWRK